MAETPELKKQLEEVLGHELAEGVVQKLNFWSPVASYVRSFDESYTTWRNIIVGIFPKQCVPTATLDASGQAVSGSDGKSVFRLSAFVCLDPSYSLGAPVNVVATPNSANPFFLTVQHSIVDNATDVEITISTWDANGVAAPQIAFDWRCRVALVPAPILLSAGGR